VLAFLLTTVASANGQNSKSDTLFATGEIDSLVARLRYRMDAIEADGRATFTSLADSLASERTRREAERSRKLRVVVSLFERQLFVMLGEDTLLAAPAAVASGMTLDYAGRSWTFRTPRGVHRVLRKSVDPVWRPPDWLYAEVALEHGLELRRLDRNQPVRLPNGDILTVRDSLVGVVPAGTSDFVPLPTDEHIVFDGFLYIPPLGTTNRRVTGELGSFALDLGDGYLIHGTPDPSSIGRAITHGCIRLSDEDIAWLYRFVPEGAPVYIY
jgi:hypothetical protein